jgi:hypothetical protein
MLIRWMIPVILVFSPVASAGPGKVPVQGVLTDGAGAPLNGPRDVEFTLYNGESYTWSATYTVQFEEGSFYAVLGQNGDLDLDVFGLAGGMSVSVTLDGVESTPTDIFWAPRAAYAANAGALEGMTRDQFREDTEEVPWALVAGAPSWVDESPTGFGIILDDGQDLALDPDVVHQLAGDVCFDTVEELTDALSGYVVEPGDAAFTATSGPPFTVASTEKVVGLNADSIDGVDSAALLAPRLTFPSPLSTMTLNATNGSVALTLRNDGQAVASGLNVQITPPFAQTNNCGTSLAAGASCVITATLPFQSERPGQRPGVVSVSSTGSSATSAVAATVTSYTSCKALLAANAALGTGVYFVDPTGAGSFPVHCDMTTDLGGWTLVMAFGAGSRFAAGNGIWHDTSYDPLPITPTNIGKSLAYSTVAGTHLMFRMNSEQADNWATYTLAFNRTVLDVVGSTPLAMDGFPTSQARANLVNRSRGSAAHACFNRDWQSSVRHGPSSDSTPDSSIFMPSGVTTSARPCGGSNAYATGVGVRTDSATNTGASEWSGYGGNFEGTGGDTGGNTAVFGSGVSIYIR